MPTRRTHSAPRRDRGFALIYIVVMAMFLFGIISLAVDVARYQIAATQVQAAADASALYAAAGLIGGTAGSVRTRAANAAADNKVNGVAVSLDTTNDVEFGIWDPLTRTFNVVASGAETSATAVRVTVRCTAARGKAVPLSFAAIIGVKTIDVSRQAIATIGAVTGNIIPGVACPWLAGMPIGSAVAATDGNTIPSTAPANCPILFSDITPGQEIRFASASGNTTWGNGDPNTAGAGTAGCDGDPTFIAGQAACNGIGTTRAPLNALVGIFLNDNAPNLSATSTGLDFSLPTSRDFTSLSPALKQVFFIGDGLNSAGTLQTFNPPSGATRLYIGIVDEKGWWWDNVGNLTFTMVKGRNAVLVQ